MKKFLTALTVLSLAFGLLLTVTGPVAATNTPLKGEYQTNVENIKTARQANRTLAATNHALRETIKTKIAAIKTNGTVLTPETLEEIKTLRAAVGTQIEGLRATKGEIRDLAAQIKTALDAKDLAKALELQKSIMEIIAKRNAALTSINENLTKISALLG